MESRIVISILEKNGWVFSRQKGDHLTFKKKGVPYVTTVPHPVKDLPPGTLANIKRTSGLKFE